MQELKKMKIWICWNHTLTRDNKPTKKPLSANGTTTGTNESIVALGFLMKKQRFLQRTRFQWGRLYYP